MGRRVVHPRNFDSKNPLACGLILGFVACWTCLLMQYVSATPWLFVVVPAVWLGLAVGFLYELPGPTHAVKLGLGFGLGLVAMPLLLALGAGLVYLLAASSRNTLWSSVRSGALVIGAVLVVAATTALFAVLVWWLRRLVLGRPLVQDGTLCPGCAYSLVGNESLICPECGRSYTSAEIGIDDAGQQCKHSSPPSDD